MKKLLIVLAFASVSVASFAQEPTEKYSVATNSFWSNWFVQVGAQWNAFYSGEEHGDGLSRQPWKSFRSNPQVGIAIGKWFTPGLGLRLKADGIWGKTVVFNENGKGKSFKYINLQFQPILNVSNLLCGYNPNRVYNFSVFAGGGMGRNFSADTYFMGLSCGILNQFYVSPKVAINLELGWNRLENDFDGFATGTDELGGNRGWDSHDNYLYAEIGLTYNIGKTGWAKTPDVDAINAQHQMAIDALNAKLRDAQAENDRLRNMLANQKPQVETVPQSVKDLIATPISVFFNLNKIDIASQKDLVNVRALAKFAKENDRNLLVTGYADSATGTPEHNQELSENRAKTVADELVKMGIAESKIKTVGKGGVETLSPVSFNRRATVQVTE